MEGNVKAKYVGIKATELSRDIIKNVDPRRKFTANLDAIFSMLEGVNLGLSYLDEYYDMAEKLFLNRKIYTSIRLDQLDRLRGIRDKFGLKNLVYAIDLVIANFVNTCRYSNLSGCSSVKPYIEKYESIKPSQAKEEKRRFFNF